jgi:hypothetical protein
MHVYMSSVVQHCIDAVYVGYCIHTNNVPVHRDSNLLENVLKHLSTFTQNFVSLWMHYFTQVFEINKSGIFFQISKLYIIRRIFELFIHFLVFIILYRFLSTITSSCVTMSGGIH